MLVFSFSVRPFRQCNVKLDTIIYSVHFHSQLGECIKCYHIHKYIHFIHIKMCARTRVAIRIALFSALRIYIYICINLVWDRIFFSSSVRQACVCLLLLLLLLLQQHYIYHFRTFISVVSFFSLLFSLFVVCFWKNTIGYGL